VNYITRKEIAAILGVSVRTISRRQAEWGLNSCITDSCRRPIAFSLPEASIALMRARVISRPIQTGTAVPGPLRH
jgi:hypothetical protein